MSQIGMDLNRHQYIIHSSFVLVMGVWLFAAFITKHDKKPVPMSPIQPSVMHHFLHVTLM
jgi:hypothetical protein